MFVYKYRNGSIRDIKSLVRNQFYSASSESLNDILEATIIIDNTQFDLLDIFLKNGAPELDISLKSILNKFLVSSRSFGIYSLSKKYNDELLWAYYANSHKGFCIEYDLNILKQYQLNREFFCDVEYQQNIPIITLSDLTDENLLAKKLLATKSTTWEHEAEFRILTGYQGIYHYYNRALKAIYFGYRAEKKTIKLIMKLLKGRNVQYYQMHPKKDLYELERREIKDIYQNYVNHEKQYCSFTPEYDDKIRPYQDLITKAIQILQKEPMCGKILDAYISDTKGTKENPVFYITYEDKIRGLPAINYFISKEEILSANL